MTCRFARTSWRRTGPHSCREVVVACPVLGRPQNVRPLILSLSASLANVPCRLLFLASPDDPKEIAALEEEEATHSVMEWPAGHGDFARKINWAFSHSEEEWIFFCGDDVDFGYAWADNALAIARSTESWARTTW